ncbi:MAG: 16S rRNA (adenine(1518)-N(6)/adenine(1519)-N(6))-dimethyltransferase RsmA [Pseudomonadota bacterium]
MRPDPADGAALDALPSLSNSLRDAGIDARRALGQNFLLDLNLTRRIARTTGALEGTTVVEIGPGPGGLTRGLLLEGTAHVIAIERDARFLPLLERIGAAAPGRLSVHQADALKIDWPDIVGDHAPVRLIANLPYNIATELLTGWLDAEPWPSWFETAALMFQREVADRITAEPGDAAYGRLAVLCGWRCRAERLFDIPPDAFVPRPKVVSSVVRLTPKSVAPGDPSASALRRVTAAAFGQRRKMLRSSLKQVFATPIDVLDQCGIAETARAEELDRAAFLTLAKALEAQTPG